MTVVTPLLTSFLLVSGIWGVCLAIPFWMVNWLIAGAILIRERIFSKTTPLFSSAVILLFFGFSSILTFKERVSQFPPIEPLLNKMKKFGILVRTSNPEFDSALTRAVLRFRHAPLYNMGIASGLSTLEGYWFPPQRFSELFSRLEGKPFAPGRSVFAFPKGVTSKLEKNPSFEVLRQLYNLTTGFEIEGPHGIETVYFGPTAGEAWFSSQVERVSSQSELVEIFLQHQEEIHSWVKKVTYLISSDPEVEIDEVPRSIHPNCGHSQVLKVSAPIGKQKVFIDVKSTGNCLLSIPMNFVTNLVAYSSPIGTVDPAVSGTKLKVFPVNGPLTGLMIPEGKYTILIKPNPVQSVLIEVLFWLGIILSFGIGLWILLFRLKPPIQALE